MGRTLHVHRQNFQAVWISINQRQHRYSQHVAQALQEYPAHKFSTLFKIQLRCCTLEQKEHYMQVPRIKALDHALRSMMTDILHYTNSSTSQARSQVCLYHPCCFLLPTNVAPHRVATSGWPLAVRMMQG